MAVIDEAWCIGCTLCLDACPTDAILGTTKRMHTVIEPHCTGCELCIPACPVDCIALEDVTPGRSGWQAWSKTQADAALARYAVHSLRIGAGRSDIENAAEAAPPTVDPAPSVRTAVDDAAAERKRAVVAAALARARDARTPRP
jgi:electron transport complex protein RnfB